MVRKIKLFQWIRKMYQIIGIDPSCQSGHKFLSKYKKFGFLVLLVAMFIGLTASILFEAETTADRAIGFSTAALAATAILFFSTTALKMENIIEMIGKFEDFIEMSEPPI